MLLEMKADEVCHTYLEVTNSYGAALKPCRNNKDRIDVNSKQMTVFFRM